MDERTYRTALFPCSYCNAAWNGVVPSQRSTGGRSTLGGITKTGNRYLRALLAQCACAVIQNASRHLEQGKDTHLNRFALRLKLNGKPAKKIMITVANKIIRILWAMLTQRKTFENKANEISDTSAELQLA